MRRRPRRGRAEPDRHRGRARRPGRDDAGQDARAGARRPAAPDPPVRAARLGAVVRGPGAPLFASGGRRRLHHHGVLVLRGDVGDEHDQHRRRAARDGAGGDDRTGDRAGSRGAGRARARARRVRVRSRRADHIRERPVVCRGTRRADRGARSRLAVGRRGLRRRVLRVRRRGGSGLLDHARRGARPRRPGREDPAAREPAGDDRPSDRPPLVRGLRRSAAGRRRCPPRDDRLPRPARPLAHRHRHLSANRGARSSRSDGLDVRGGVRHRHPVRGPDRAARGFCRGARDHRAGLDHGVPSAGRGPDGSFGGRVQALGHVGGRIRGRPAQRANAH